MSTAYGVVIAASDADRRALFAAAARRLGTTEQNIEKDFWVCWTLDALFHRLPPDGPRLLFKGGTSLSKAFGLINRFSEDIDITVFRTDLGEPISLDELEALSGKKRRVRLDAIKDACQRYVHGDLRAQLTAVLAGALRDAGLAANTASVSTDPADADGQTLLVHYPSIINPADPYVRPSVRIESGAKSALDPHVNATITPYVAADLEAADLAVTGVTTIEAARTFWDKVIILHGLRRWFDRRGDLRQEGQRVSRHYYDVHLLRGSSVGRAALTDLSLGAECARHARMFFDRPDLDLATAAPGSFALVPVPAMRARLERDYDSMAGMIFGDIPVFDDVMQTVVDVEAQLNRAAR
jgi:hypothetical protein